MSTSQNDNMICTVCRQQKFQLRTRKSRVMEELPLYLCNECFVNKKEPRFAIIMVGRSRLKQNLGLGPVEDVIKHHRYVGEEILVKDLL